ncbi:3-hydroxyacyl-CoA dehydrogenase NAD-binding domain-containing protein [soil metagenome]
MSVQLSPTVTLERREDVALYWCDNPPVNAISQSIRAGIVGAMRQFKETPGLRAAVIICRGKGFFAGADITEFGKPSLGPPWEDMIDSIEMSSKPVVAAIHGNCLGGGFEVALACHYRIASADARFGFPEVKLGLIPGSGGTQRLSRLAGFEAALDLIPSARLISAGEAKTIGILESIADGDLAAAASQLARDAAGTPPPRTRDKSDAIDGARHRAPDFTAAREAIRRRKPGHTAPLMAIDAIENALTLPFDEAVRAESAIFSACQESLEHKALSHLFFAERAARWVPDIPANLRERPIERIAVVGGGTMGRGITLAFAGAGLPVCLIEESDGAAQSTQTALQRELDRSVAKKRLTDKAAAGIMSHIEMSADLASAHGAGLVIEAVFEDMDVKRTLFGALDDIMQAGAILASNTSNLDLNHIAQATSRPQDVVGLHFFSPANVMKLVEIVRGKLTSPDVLSSVLSLAKRIGKQPIVAGVCDGFIVNRAFGGYWRESRFLVEEGASPYAVDEALVAFGMPLGPFAVSDLVGLDVSNMIRANQRKARGAPARPDMLEDKLVEHGRLGRKNGRGWYTYKDGAHQRSQDEAVLRQVDEHRRASGFHQRDISPQEIIARCLYCVINEGAKELEDGVALRASDIDVGAVLGYGFPAYRGGPMFYGDTVGLQSIAATVARFHETHGDTWTPSPLLLGLARGNRTFAAHDSTAAA